MVVYIITSLLFIAFIQDLNSRCVKNEFICIAYMIGIIYCSYCNVSVLKTLFLIIFPIIILFPLFFIRGIGAGDIKLFSVLSVFVGCFSVINIIILSFYIAGIICLIKIIFIKNYRNSFTDLKNYIKKIIITRNFIYSENIISSKHYTHFTGSILAAYLIYQLLGISFIR